MSTEVALIIKPARLLNSASKHSKINVPIDYPSTDEKTKHQNSLFQLKTLTSLLAFPEMYAVFSGRALATVTSTGCVSEKLASI